MRPVVEPCVDAIGGAVADRLQTVLATPKRFLFGAYNGFGSRSSCKVGVALLSGSRRVVPAGHRVCLREASGDGATNDRLPGSRKPFTEKASGLKNPVCNRPAPATTTVPATVPTSGGL